MSTTRILAPAVALASAVLLTTATPALAKDGDVRTSGACQGVADLEAQGQPGGRPASRSRPRSTATAAARPGTGP